ncbi:MAG: TatD DNase family protein [Candidatus Pseudothioglobus sp.]|jgi:TatD DNase family protein|tara:strand:- start:5292 stop:5987 length:696 start_codon:yes stop_codon:yes gene_type:complete
MLNSHIHLDFDNVNSPSNSTTGVIVPSTGKDNWDSVIACCSTDNNSHFALGIHPWFIESHQMIDLYDLEVRIEEEKPVAVGECGLDYVKVKDQNTQRFMFDEQISLATRFDLPLIIHSVQATEDVTDLLKSHSKSRGVIHAYSGSIQQAENLLKINFSFGFGNTLTNPQAYKLHDIVKFLPMESIVIETDDHKNPDELIQVAERVARIKKLTVDQVIEQCDQNTRNIFNID